VFSVLLKYHTRCLVSIKTVMNLIHLFCGDFLLINFTCISLRFDGKSFYLLLFFLGTTSKRHKSSTGGRHGILACSRPLPLLTTRMNLIQLKYVLIVKFVLKWSINSISYHLLSPTYCWYTTCYHLLLVYHMLSPDVGILPAVGCHLLSSTGS